MNHDRIREEDGDEGEMEIREMGIRRQRGEAEAVPVAGEGERRLWLSLPLQ